MASAGSPESWNPPGGNGSIFFPDEFKAIGVFKASAIYMHVFLTLVTTATLGETYIVARVKSLTRDFILYRCNYAV